MPWVTRYHRYDGQGNTRLLTDESGTATDSFTYDAWGSEVARTGNTKTPFRWNGRVGYYWDEDAGTYQVRRRPYSPKIARFLIVDPNTFSNEISFYSIKDPVNLFDPSGTVIIRLQPSHLSVPWSVVNDTKFKDVLGVTIGKKPRIQCRCVCERRRFRIRRRIRLTCTIDASFHIIIFRNSIKELNRNANQGSIPHTEDGVYGHEQRHVESLQGFFRKIQSELEKEEQVGVYGNRMRHECNSRAQKLNEEYWRRFVRFLWGEQHWQDQFGKGGWPRNPAPSPYWIQDYPIKGKKGPQENVPEGWEQMTKFGVKEIPPFKDSDQGPPPGAPSDETLVPPAIELE